MPGGFAFIPAIAQPARPTAGGGSPPTVGQVSPFFGFKAGGQAVKIPGSGFTGATGATLGGVAVTSFTVVDDTTITGVAGSTGSYSAGLDVVVHHPSGDGTAPGTWAYLPDGAVIEFISEAGLTLSGSTITAITDQSPAATPLAVGGAPVLNASDPEYNGAPSFSLDGAADFVQTAGGPTIGGYTLFIAAKNVGTARYFLNTSYGYVYSSITYSIFEGARSGAAFGAQVFNQWGQAVLPRLLTYVFDGTSAGMVLRLNGVDVPFSFAVSGDPGNDSAAVAIQFFSTGSSAFAEGSAALGILYGRTLTADEYHCVEDAVIGRYKLWDFSQLPGISCVFDAGINVTLNTSTVASLGDVVNKGIEYTLDQADPTLQPTWNPTGIGGLPSLDYPGGGVGQYLAGTGADLTQGTGQVMLFGIIQTTDTGVAFVWGRQYNHYFAALFLTGGCPQFFVDDTPDHCTSLTSIADGEPHCFICVADGTDVSIYIDDPTTPVATTPQTSGTITPTGDVNSMGASAQDGTTHDRAFIGSLALVGAASLAGSAPTRSKVMRALKIRARMA